MGAGGGGGCKSCGAVATIAGWLDPRIQGRGEWPRAGSRTSQVPALHRVGRTGSVRRLVRPHGRCQGSADEAPKNLHSRLRLEAAATDRGGGLQAPCPALHRWGGPARAADLSARMGGATVRRMKRSWAVTRMGWLPTAAGSRSYEPPMNRYSPPALSPTRLRREIQLEILSVVSVSSVHSVVILDPPRPPPRCHQRAYEEKSNIKTCEAAGHAPNPSGSHAVTESPHP